MGPQGIQGLTGPPGPKGDKGATGEPGKDCIEETKQDIEVTESTWNDEVAYYEELEYKPFSECPGHMITFYFADRDPPRWDEERFCCITVNDEYYSSQWQNVIYDYSVTRFRNVTSAELREEVYEFLKYGCTNPRLRTYSPLKVANPADVNVNIDSFERVIFLVRTYIESIDPEPFDDWIVVYWKPSARS